MSNLLRVCNHNQKEQTSTHPEMEQRFSNSSQDSSMAELELPQAGNTV